jgi:outer membrane protein assembly factor BamB
MILFCLLSLITAHGAPQADAFTTPPSPAWDIELPGGISNTASHAERSTPVATEEGLLLGVESSKGLFLISRKDGRTLQVYPSKASVQSSAIVHDDKIYFADMSGTTWCYKKDGELLWQHTGGAPILSNPHMENGTVYITNVEDLTVALSGETGSLVWQYRRPPSAERTADLALYSAPTPIIEDGVLLTGYSDGFVVGLNPKNGDVLWDIRVGEGRYPDIVATPTVKDGDLFVSGYFSPLIAVDLKTQNIRWRLEAGAASAGIVHEGQSGDALVHPGSDGKLRYINTTAGSIIWTWDSGNGAALTEPVLTDAGILIGSGDGGVYLIDPENGEQVWKSSYPFLLDGVTASPVVDGRMLYFLSNSGKMYSMISVAQGPKEARSAWPSWSRLNR